MKLRQIAENLIYQQLKGAGNSTPKSTSLYVSKPQQYDSSLYNQLVGYDAGSRASSAISSPVGIPSNPKHRAYLGMERRLGIRL